MNDHRQQQVKLPRTGTEQPYLRDRPRFIETHREFERIANVNVSVPDSNEVLRGWILNFFARTFTFFTAELAITRV